MVVIHLPPPKHNPDPIIECIAAGTRLVRIFDPTDHGATPISFRYFGPLRRFDHHRVLKSAPSDDRQRGIYYAAPTLESCVVEVFGDSRLIACAEYHVCMPHLNRPLKLLDIRGNGAMRAGSVAALSQNADYGPSQAWSRYFYDQQSIYSVVDGIIYLNAHNHMGAIALYERAHEALECPPERVIRLDDPRLRPGLIDIARRTGLTPPAP